MGCISFFTLGCKLNQLETEAIAGAFKERGFSILPWEGAGPEDLLIVNTCTVTSRAEQKARRIIRLFLRRGCAVLITGCYARLGEAELAALGTGKNLPFMAPSKDTLLDLPRFLADKAGPWGELLSRWREEQHLPGQAEDGASRPFPAAFRFNPRTFLFHSRAFLKIQDGCDRSCAYCRVPLARGKSISLESGELLTRLRALEAQGIPEAVLTGVNICQYRSPGDTAVTLPVLLRILLENTGRIALRLSSIDPEPAVLTDEFFHILSHRRIRPHFHLSVQSGSSRILSAMGRPYGAEDIIHTVDRLRSVKEDPFLACDIITGFPGETPGDFESSAGLCRNLNFAAIHGFPYSPREGTRAALLKNQVGRDTAGKRLAVLLELSRQGKRDYINRWRGRVLGAVAESEGAGASEKRAAGSFLPGKKNFSPSFFPALTDNYIRILLSAASEDPPVRPKPGSTVRCSVREPLTEGNFDAWGEVVV
ncbi:MAG: radical SAM protein [Spirochaetaceae bacterium]|jgi:threonylcarbamoyladenosine tRNA methylthiotransferase MtaB|nr:radical SAM protein [Spirochaetaceae bacterium]